MRLRWSAVAASALATSLAVACGAPDETDGTALVEQWPEADELFRQDERWRGADDAYSVDLGGGRSVWLFADTLVSTDPDHRRPPFPTTRNSVGIMAGTDPTSAAMSMHWGRTRKGLPASFFPEEGDAWFWPGDGERIGADGPLLVFLMRIRRDPAGSPGWDFKAAGWRAVLIPNPDDEPEAWRVQRVRSQQNPWRIVVGSGSVLAHDGWLYAFSVQEPSHDVHVARWPLAAARAGNLGSPQWWAGRKRGFVPQPSLNRTPTPIFRKGQTEFTVHMSRSGGFVAVQTIGFGAATIGIRRAPALTGPWSPARFVWRPPEAGKEAALI
jgi:hypothetical protein